MVRSLCFSVMVCLGLASSAFALTLKSGQVLGSDGEVYDGASPEQAEQLAKNAQKKDFFGNQKSSGVVGQNLFVVVEGSVVFVPLKELQGKDRASVTQTVKDYITDHLVSALKAQHIAEEGEIDAETLKEFEALGDANSEYGAQVAQEVTEFAQYDIEKATAVLEATLDLATVDAANEAARQAAEATFEQAFEAAYEAASEAYDAVNGEGAYCEKDPNCEVWTPDSD